MRLLTDRTTNTEYPADNALIQRFIKPWLLGGVLVDVMLGLSGTITAGTDSGVEFSQDEGATWKAALISAADAGATPKFALPNNCLVRPKHTAGDGSTSTTDLIG